MHIFHWFIIYNLSETKNSKAIIFNKQRKSKSTNKSSSKIQCRLINSHCLIYCRVIFTLNLLSFRNKISEVRLSRYIANLSTIIAEKNLTSNIPYSDEFTNVLRK